MHGFEWGMHDSGSLMYGGVTMIITWLIVIALMAVLVVWITRHTQNTQQSQAGLGSGTTDVKREDPLEILRTRYARSEIDKAEYEEKLKDLNG